MRFTVTVYRLQTPDGPMYVCTDGMLERLRADQSEPAKVALQRYEELLPHCDEERYEMRVYTFGERLQAEWQCTDWSSGEPRLNTARLSMTLLAHSLGKTLEEVETLHPQLGQLLYAELQMRANPSPFAWNVSASKQPNSETASPPGRSPKSSCSRGGSEDACNST